MTTFEERLRKILTSRGYSPEKLVEEDPGLVGSGDTIRKWCSKMPKSLIIFARMCKKLGCSSDELLGLPPASPDGHLKTCIVQILRLRSTCDMELNRLLELMTGGISFKNDREKTIEIVKEWAGDLPSDRVGKREEP